jgi:hypothetical protein
VKALDPEMTTEVDKQLGDIKRLELLAKARQKKIAETMLSGYVDDAESNELIEEPKVGFFLRLYQKAINSCKRLANFVLRRG